MVPVKCIGEVQSKRNGPFTYFIVGEKSGCNTHINLLFSSCIRVK